MTYGLPPPIEEVENVWPPPFGNEILFVFEEVDFDDDFEEEGLDSPLLEDEDVDFPLDVDDVDFPLLPLL